MEIRASDHVAIGATDRPDTPLSCRLVLGQKNYSSWSMRAWLLLRHLGIPFDEVTVPLYGEGSRDDVRAQGGETGLVPVLVHDGLAIWDTLAIFETLHERHGGVWPSDPASRARARSYVGEIHSAFGAFRAAMPVNTRARGRRVAVSAETQADIDRAETIWRRADGPWLFGEFGGADIMFSPIATRFQTYGVRLAGRAEAYRRRLLGHPLVKEWLELGAAETNVIPLLEVGEM
jgi:glutathione S-transferase